MPITKVTFSKDEITKILSEYVEKEHGRKAGHVQFCVETQYDDRPYGSGTSYAVFGGVEVTLGEKTQITTPCKARNEF